MLWLRLLRHTMKSKWDYGQIILFVIMSHYCTHNNVIAGLIIWLGLASISLGLLDKDKFIKLID